MIQPVIRLEDVWKIYKMDEVDVTALHGINLKIYPKEFVSLVGKSGSGKSTALNLIGCLDIPTRGKVYLDQKDISTLEESDLAQIRGRKIGFIFQTFNLIPQLTALENVMLPTMFQDGFEQDKKRKAQILLEKVDLIHRANHLPSQLSGGERQRVAIARALINNPEVILADEPTGNLDSKTGAEVINILQKLHKEEGKTVILITHDASIAKSAQKMFVLSDGQIVKEVKQ